MSCTVLVSGKKKNICCIRCCPNLVYSPRLIINSKSYVFNYPLRVIQIFGSTKIIMIKFIFFNGLKKPSVVALRRN